MELSNSEYQALVNDQAELVQTKREVEKLKTEMDNKEKAFQDERDKRKKETERAGKLQKDLDLKNEEISEIQAKYENFEDIEANANKWTEYENKKVEETTSKLESLKWELWEEALEKHSRFLESMPDDLKIEYLEWIKGWQAKPDYGDIPKWDAVSPSAVPSEQASRLEELNNKKSNWIPLSPFEKMERVNLIKKENWQ